MSDTFLFIAILVAQAVFVFLVMKLLPGAVIKYVDKEIDRRSDIKLEKVKGEIQGSYATLKTSVDMLSASNSGLHPHIIEAVSAMWTAMVEMRDLFGGMLTFDSIILANEAADLFAGKDNNTKVMRFIEKYKDGPAEEVGELRFFESKFREKRLFCGDKLWLHFNIFRSILARNAMLLTWSYEKSSFQDWRTDKGMRQLMYASLPPDVVEKAFGEKIGGLTNVLTHIESQFLHEATRVMSGSKAMADSLADMQSVLQLQNSQINLRLEDK